MCASFCSNLAFSAEREAIYHVAIVVASNLIGRYDPGRPGADDERSSLYTSSTSPIILRSRNDVDLTLVTFEFTATHREAADSGRYPVAS